MTKKELYGLPEAFATTLIVALIDDFGTEVFSWEPEAIEMEITDKYAMTIPPRVFDRMMAGVGLLTTNMFWKSLPAFNAVCRALNFKHVAGDTMYPANLEDVMWGITEADMLLGGTDGGDTTFCPAISLYVGKLLEGESILDPPKLLSFAQITRLPMDAQQIANMPDISEMFEINQADTKEELDARAMKRILQLLEQVGSLKLAASDLKEFHEVRTRLEKGLRNA